ncbi:MAG: DUF3387 domain-containing protein [Spirochaetales bacterium]|nr:DUF3387 domain-containing protein [Spirochaetales bacterium]
MTRITESAIETFAVELLEKHGYQYIYGPDIAPDGEAPERASFEDVLLPERIKKAVSRINPAIPADAREDAVKQTQRLNSPELIADNESFHRMLTEGVKVACRKDGSSRGELVWLIDFNDPENNDFIVLNQYTVIENHVNKRPDVVLFVNGLPLVVMELKNPADENVTVHSAFKQLQTYIRSIPSLFAYNGFLIVSDGLEAKAGTISSGYNRFMAWKTADGNIEASPLIGQLETLIRGMLDKKTLLDLIRHFIVFEKSGKEDRETGVITVRSVKKLAAYHQYYAVNRAVESTLRAAGYGEKTAVRAGVSMVKESPESYGVPGVKSQPAGDKKGGVVWHTQGSGKSLSMVFYAGKIVLAMDNPTILVITDRNDLDDQLFDTFASSRQLLRQEPVQAGNREQLKELLKVASGGVVFTTIQKFQPEEGNVYEKLSDRTNIVVIADEAHRTQYGFKAKTIDDKDENGNVTGKKLVLILSAEEHILGLENGRKRFIDEVTALSKALSIAIPHEKAMDVKDEVAFFQAVKSRLVKFDITGEGRTDEEVGTAIRQVVDKALVTEKVIDVFDTAGIQKPDISILSEDFLLEVKNMEHKNIALEVLKKLLNDEIKSRTKKNLIQGKTLMEMLENSIRKYHNKILTAAEVIEDLIELSREIHEMDKEPQEMGLSDYEYAFYTAIANNESARQVMEQEKLRELAVVLYEKVKENASIDWSIKESVKAKLKVIVKRVLRQYGYPPDMQMLATETVLKQAELIAEELTSGK